MTVLLPERRSKLFVRSIWLFNLFLVAMIWWWWPQDPGTGPKVAVEQMASAEDVEMAGPVAPLLAVEKESPVGLVLLVVGLGPDKQALNSLRKIDLPLILGVVPQEPYSRDYCDLAKEQGWPAIAHIPMEPSDPEQIDHPSCLTSDRSREEVAAELEKMISSLTWIYGLSNHQGAKLTENGRLMEEVARFAKKHDYFIVDNKNGGSSQLYKKAQAAEVPVLRRDIYLDGDGTPGTEASVKSQLLYAQELALREERPIVMVAHARPATLSVLKQIPQILDLNKTPILELAEIF